MLVVAVPVQATCFRHRLPQPQIWAEGRPQVVPLGHVVGQLNVPPQLSPILPQYCWTPAELLHATFTQSDPPTHTLFVPHTQLAPEAVQSVPQGSALPQPSPTVPQYWPPAAGLQVRAGHTPGTPLHRPPWQVHPAFVHAVPQSTDDPQPFPTTPQYWSPLAVVQASGRHPEPPLHRPPWQVHPDLVHAVPQSTDDPHPFPTTPQY